MMNKKKLRKNLYQAIDKGYCKPEDAREAFALGIIGQTEYGKLLKKIKKGR